MWRHIASNALTFLIVLLFLLAGVIGWGNREYTARGPLETAICLQVERGSNMRGVSEELAEIGAITQPAIFRIGADYSDKASQLKAGSFLVPRGASMEEIIEIVTASGQSTCGTEIVHRIGVTRVQSEVRELNPETREYEDLAQFDPTADERPAIYAEKRQAPDTQYRVVVSEGVTSWQVMTALNRLEVLSGEIGEVPDEGSLAPGSYQVVPGDDAAALVGRMQQAQSRILAEAWAGREEGLPLETPQEALILASIVEKETGGYDEVRTVASVFENLFQNAVDHADGASTVRVGTFDEGFFVEDDGCGIPAGKRDAVLEDGYSSKSSGTGLGLAVVQTIAEVHGWSLTVDDSYVDGIRLVIGGANVDAA